MDKQALCCTVGIYYKKHNVLDFPGGLVLKTCTFNTGGMCSIPGQVTKISHATQCDKKKDIYTHLYKYT